MLFNLGNLVSISYLFIKIIEVKYPTIFIKHNRLTKDNQKITKKNL